MVRLTKDQARKLINNKLPVCEYCKSIFKTDKELLSHLKEVHGKHVIKKKTRRRKRTVDPFKPEKVYNYWIKNKDKWESIGSNNPFNKRDVRDLVVIDYIDVHPVLYVWDKDKQEYRIYSDSYNYEPWTEIIYDNNILMYRLKVKKR